MKALLTCALATLFAFGLSPDLRAQGIDPNKTIRLVVPCSAGGTGDRLRSPAAPDLPTIAEAGVAGYDFNGRLARFTPAGSPKAVIDVLAAVAGNRLRTVR